MGLKEKYGEKPSRTRRCNRGRRSQYATVSKLMGRRDE